MKRTLSILLIAFMLLAVAAAPADARRVKKQTLIDTTLDDDPTTYTCSAVDVGGFSKITFYVDYDETEVGNSVSGKFSYDVSYDGTNWATGYYLDGASLASLQNSETFSVDDDVWAGYVHVDMVIPYIRCTFDGVNTDTDDTIDVTVSLIGIE